MEIEEAAQFIKVHPITLSEMARRGEIPAAKPGKKWVFIDVDLVEWLRSNYKAQASVSDSTERSNACHFSNAKTHETGGSKLLPPTESEYKKQLGLK
ncbi:helix-turn-helix domain-containing protein [Methylobacillus rhizosphaerae]